MRAGTRSYIPGIGAIRITNVEPAEPEALSDADAVPADGFPTTAELAAELRAINAERTNGIVRPTGASSRGGRTELSALRIGVITRRRSERKHFAKRLGQLDRVVEHLSDADGEEDCGRQ